MNTYDKALAALRNLKLKDVPSREGVFAFIVDAEGVQKTFAARLRGDTQIQFSLTLVGTAAELMKQVNESGKKKTKVKK